MPVGAGLSLKGRALRLLSQREHSRNELIRKLAPHAESPEQLDAVLVQLEQGGFLSQRRFAESLAHRRGERFGVRRIEQELEQHRIDAVTAQAVLAPLRATERERALEAWRKRFGTLPGDMAERARQHRFLAQRGFSGEAIGWVLRHAADPPDEHSHT
jgi:regulatory protein